MRELTSQEIRTLLSAKCPFCGSQDLKAGDEQGVSLQISCGDCEAGFNLEAFGDLGGQLLKEPRLRLGRVES